MDDIFKLVAVHKGITKGFSIWLYNRLGKDNKKYNAFTTYPNSIKVPTMLLYLEANGIPILEALCYYNYQLDNVSYNELCYYMIVKEFERIEKQLPANYNPF